MNHWSLSLVFLHRNPNLVPSYKLMFLVQVLSNLSALDKCLHSHRLSATSVLHFTSIEPAPQYWCSGCVEIGSMTPMLCMSIISPFNFEGISMNEHTATNSTLYS